MLVNNFGKLLRENSYPGRGIAVGLSAEGTHAVISYFIMGRSENSRNRIFVETDDGIQTKAFDESKLTDPSLIIYAPVRTIGNTTIVTNGDQTDTIYEFLEKGDTFKNALATRTFEPDAPNYTPRISAEVVTKDGKLAYTLSILKRNTETGEVVRDFFEYNTPEAGVAHFIHTYACDGEPLPSFTGEPVLVEVKGKIYPFASNVWGNLNFQNKVSLYTQTINLSNGAVETMIHNRLAVGESESVIKNIR